MNRMIKKLLFDAILIVLVVYAVKLFFPLSLVVWVIFWLVHDRLYESKI